jgi:hypothetical protein
MASSDFFDTNKEYYNQRDTRAGVKMNITLGGQAVKIGRIEVVWDDKLAMMRIIHLHPEGYPWG